VSSSETNVVEIIEADTELRANEWVSGRVEFTSNAVGLEAIDTSSHVIYVVSPASNHGVSLDGLTWDSG
jgi:hypothetical protein